MLGRLHVTIEMERGYTGVIHNTKGIALIQAFFTIFALQRMGGFSATNVICVVLLVIFVYLYHNLLSNNVIKDRTKKERWVTISLSMVLSFLYVVGDMENLYGELTNLAFRVVILVGTFIGLAILISYTIFLGYALINKTDIYVENQTTDRKSNIIVIAITMIACLAIWSIHFLACFPGVVTPDGINQFAQVINAYQASNHHPYMHTLLIKLLYNIGMFFTGDRVSAIAFYTAFQMILMSGAAAYLVVTLKKIGLKRCVYYCTIAFFALMPYNADFAVYVGKDSVFAASFLVYTTVLVRIASAYREGEFKLSKRDNITSWVIYTIAGIAISIFRTNGWYAFIIMVPFMLVIFRKKIKYTLITNLLVIAVVLLIKGPLMDSMEVVQPDLVESMAMPTQQISRVIVEKREITPQQREFLNKILDIDRIHEGYNPHVSDWFKKLVREGDQQYLIDNFGEFVKVYIELGVRYPSDYLMAYRDQTIGYYFPSNYRLLGTNMGVFENEFGVASRPIIKGKLVIKVNEIVCKLKDIVPIYGSLSAMGAVLWLILFALVIQYMRGDKTILLVPLAGLALVVTLFLATPVAYDFRYAYGYMFAIPIYIIVPFLRKPQELK